MTRRQCPDGIRLRLSPIYVHKLSIGRNDHDTFNYTFRKYRNFHDSTEQPGLFTGRAADGDADAGRSGILGRRLPDTKVVGSTVVNEANETVGTIDDLIVTPNAKVPFAVLSVGGFLGMDTKYVVVPFSELQMHDKQMLLPGATKESLTSLPEFKYSY